METSIIKIGNSRGIIIPAEVLKRLGLEEKNVVSLTVDGDTLIARGRNVSPNMLKTQFYVCPVCGNVIHCVGDAAVACHGINLRPLEPQLMDDENVVSIEKVEDEAFLSVQHPMTKKDYIAFVAAVSADKVQLIRLFPEGNAETRFNPIGVKALYYYSTKDGLYKVSAKLLANRLH